MLRDIEMLTRTLGRLPGVGRRSAQRIALALLKDRQGLMQSLSAVLADTAERIKTCGECGNLDTAQPCDICRQTNRNQRQLCVVEDIDDLWALERSTAWRGLYHVLGGTLSALDGRGPEILNLDGLRARVEQLGVEEVVVALPATADGQTTSHYVADLLKGLNVTVTRLGQGVPMGGALDYLDDGTLIAALKARQTL